ncbi:YraN family protein [Deinococcus sp.]|uniref:YraN family protein n=1 Tax=Deinococcus sp. TaxID=47478 RepID=UPI0025B95E23|nr:YraN family protein [Deinococcus sp.]
MKGADAEARAARYLQELGREIVARNYRIPGGEIDLVSRDSTGRLFFTEVRQRRAAQFGSAAESVTPRKLALMRRAALTYLSRELGRDDVACQLEVLAIDGSAEGGPITLIPLGF